MMRAQKHGWRGIRDNAGGYVSCRTCFTWLDNLWPSVLVRYGVITRVIAWVMKRMGSLVSVRVRCPSQPS